MVNDWSELDQGNPCRRDYGTGGAVGACIVCGERYSIMYWTCVPGSSGPYCAAHFPKETIMADQTPASTPAVQKDAIDAIRDVANLLECQPGRFEKQYWALHEAANGVEHFIEQQEATITSQAEALAKKDAEIERLKVEHGRVTLSLGNQASAAVLAKRNAEAALKAARDELRAWRECAKYDATVEGPVFKGWDRSALDRLRLAALTPAKEP